VKVFAHGVSTAADEDAVLGPRFDATLTELEQHYNDGRAYVLHYVTAREAYNLAMAAASRASRARTSIATFLRTSRPRLGRADLQLDAPAAQRIHARAR
jgi:hypothetical protein